MSKKHFLSICLLFLTFNIFSQTLSRNQFRQQYVQGNLMMMEKFYDTAVKTFLNLHQFDSSNANINYKVGKCYVNMPGQKSKAIPYFEKAIKNSTGNYMEDDASEKNAPEDIHYLLGQAYQYTYRFDDASKEFNKFRDVIGKWNLGYVKDIDRWIEITSNAKQLYASPVNCTILNMGDSINSKYADYSPVISADESILAFTSRRLGTGGAENKTLFDNYYEDIWYVNKGPYGTWSKAKSIGRAINTEGNEATIGLSADGQQLYVYRDDNGDGNIYISKLDGEYWTAPYKMEAGNINTSHWEPSACISADGNTMYFVSDRPGGFGGRDLYVCYRLPNRSWSEPENMGATINSSFDEDAPFIHPDGVSFFFSSTGHNSMGGFDVFQSTKVAKGIWTKPENLGYPINTTDDDIYFVVSSDGRRAYYSSLKPRGKGEKDIYMVSMNKPMVKSVAILAGWIKNKDESVIPKNTIVNIKPQNGESISCKPNEFSGKFVQSLLPGQEYEITVEANNNKVYYDKFFLPTDSSYQVLGRAFFRQTIYLGDTTQLFSRNKVTDTTSRVKLIPLNGKILLSENNKEPVQNTTLQLLNNNGDVMASSITDKDGSFQFNNIPSNQKYLVKIYDKDSTLKNNNQFYLSNKDGQVVSSSESDNNVILFKNIDADINSMKAKTAVVNTPQVSYAEMKGKLMQADGKRPLSNVLVSLNNHEGKSISSIATDKDGNFSFGKIPDGNKYSLSIDKKALPSNKRKGVVLFNENNLAIQNSSENPDQIILDDLEADLIKMVELKQILLTQSDKSSVAILPTLSNPDDNQYDYVIYFPYDKKEIDINSSSFINFKAKIEKKIASHEKATIVIASSSSTVPTKKYASNNELANQRAKEIKANIADYLKTKNITDSKITYEISTKVQGPSYNKDAVKNMGEYEKWQFVKVIIK